MKWKSLCFSVLCLITTAVFAGETIEIKYEGFTVWIDCERRGAIRFEYIADKDRGNLPRKSTFSLDDDVADHCQQKSTDSYSHPRFSYDRGHLVPANHLDHSKKAIRQSNNMTNILPQARNMNRGAWKLTEEITECVRDLTKLHVIGGVVWGRNPHDDFFLDSHGVPTPDYFWKVLIREDNGEAIAWFVPNSLEARRSQLDNYLISIAELEEIVNEKIPVSGEVRSVKLERSWKKPTGCNLG